jgi:hypothetical protein
VITGPEPSRIARSGLIVTAQGQACFHCGEPAGDPVIMWSGATGNEIFLHPACVAELTIRLLRDLHELEHRTGGRLAWRDEGEKP